MSANQTGVCIIEMSVLSYEHEYVFILTDPNVEPIMSNTTYQGIISLLEHVSRYAADGDEPHRGQMNADPLGRIPNAVTQVRLCADATADGEYHTSIVWRCFTGEHNTNNTAEIVDSQLALILSHMAEEHSISTTTPVLHGKIYSGVVRWQEAH